MAITAIDKVKINRYLNEHANGDIYYLDMCDYLGKRGKIKDFEFLEYFTECVINEFSKDGKISIRHVAKLISIVGNFVEWIHEEKNEVKEEVLDKIRSFNSLYEDYLTRNNMECDNTFKEHCIGEVMEIINRLYPNINENADSLAKYVLKIKELETKIKELNRTITNLSKDNEVLQKSLDKANSSVDSLSVDISSVREELRDRKSYIKSLEAKIKEFTENLEELNELYSNITLERNILSTNVDNQNIELINCRNKIAELSSEVEKLHVVLDAIALEDENKKIQRQTEEQIKNLIYQKLLVENLSISELVKIMESNGITCDSKVISNALREMRSKINIANGAFSNNPTYRIVKPYLEANGTFTIDVLEDCKYMDVMLVSDFHVKEFDKKVLKDFDMINDYCVENGINLILNLGDLFQGFSAKNLDYNNACKNYKIVEDSINLIPRANGIYHAVLGGNHERNMTHYGFDPIKMLAEERDDFIDLGYFHSTVCLEGKGSSSKFDLHHPSNFDFPVDTDNSFVVDGMIEYLDEVYNKNNRSRNDSYVDIFGHTHRSQFNLAGSYCYIPPFYECKNGKGACHLRIYFDDKTGIKYMVFMPLVASNKLVKSSEIVYQKVLSR